MKIAVFDSGIGGMTVLEHLRSQSPEHEYYYFGDTANVPYGSKSVSKIKELSSSAAERIKEKNLDALIVACNTASSLALVEMKQILAPVPVLGVVEAGVRSVLDRVGTTPSSESAVLILGTKATVKSKIYSKLLLESLSDGFIVEQACPLLVPMIEEGWVDHSILAQTVYEYVHPYAKPTSLAAQKKVKVALLACTHYPWIRKVFQMALPGWSVIDSAEAIVAQLRENPRFLISSSPEKQPAVSWFFSDPDAVPSFVSIEGLVKRF